MKCYALAILRLGSANLLQESMKNNVYFFMAMNADETKFDTTTSISSPRNVL